MTEETYQIHAIKYAWLMRRSPDNFLGGDPHDTEMPLNYYVWVISFVLLLIAVHPAFSGRRR